MFKTETFEIVLISQLGTKSYHKRRSSTNIPRQWKKHGKKAKAAPTIQGPSDTKENHDYVELNNGTLYNIVPARQLTLAQLTFTHNTLMNGLQRYYRLSTTLHLMQMTLQL